MGDMHWGARCAIVGVGLLIVGLFSGLSEIEILGEPTPIALTDIKKYGGPPATWVRIKSAAIHHGYGIVVRRPVRGGGTEETYYDPLISVDAALKAPPSGQTMGGVRILVPRRSPYYIGPPIEIHEDGLNGVLYKGLPMGGNLSNGGTLMRAFPGLNAQNVWLLRANPDPSEPLMYLLMALGGVVLIGGGIVGVRKYA